METVGRSRYLDATVIVALITAAIYAIGYAFEIGYLAYFGVPSELVRLDIRSFLFFGAALLLLGGGWIAVVDAVPFLLQKVPLWIRKSFVYTIAAIIIGILVIWIFGVPIRAWWAAFLHAAGCFAVELVFLWGKKKASGKPFPEAALAFPDAQETTMTSEAVRLMGPAPLLAVFGLVLGSIVSLGMGHHEARTQERFLLISEPATCVALRIYEENILCVGVDLSRNVSLDEIRLIPVRDAVLRNSKLGRLRALSSTEFPMVN